MEYLDSTMGGGASVMTNVSIIPSRKYMEGKLPKKYFTVILFPSLHKLKRLGFTEAMLLKLYCVFLNINGNETGTTTISECLHYYGGKITKLIERIFIFLPAAANILYNYRILLSNENDNKRRFMNGGDDEEEEPEITEAFEYDITAQVTPSAALLMYKYEVPIQKVNDCGLSEYDFEDWLLLIWNFCTLSNDQLSEYLFEIFDYDNSGFLERADVETMYRMIYNCDGYDEIELSKIPFRNHTDTIADNDDKNKDDEMRLENQAKDEGMASAVVMIPNQNESSVSVAVSGSVRMNQTKLIISKSAFVQFCRLNRHFVEPLLDYRSRVIKWSGGRDIWNTVINFRKTTLQKFFTVKTYEKLKNESLRSQLLTITGKQFHDRSRFRNMTLEMSLEVLLMKICKLDHANEETVWEHDEEDEGEQEEKRKGGNQSILQGLFIKDKQISSSTISSTTRDKREKRLNTHDMLKNHLLVSSAEQSMMTEEQMRRLEDVRSENASVTGVSAVGVGMELLSFSLSHDFSASKDAILSNKMKIAELHQNLFRDIEEAKSAAEELKQSLDDSLDEIESTEYYISDVMSHRKVRLSLFQFLDDWKEKNEVYYQLLDAKEREFADGTPADNHRRYLDFIDTEEGSLLRKMYIIKLTAAATLQRKAQDSAQLLDQQQAATVGDANNSNSKVSSRRQSLPSLLPSHTADNEFLQSPHSVSMSSASASLSLKGLNMSISIPDRLVTVKEEDEDTISLLDQDRSVTDAPHTHPGEGGDEMSQITIQEDNNELHLHTTVTDDKKASENNETAMNVSSSSVLNHPVSVTAAVGDGHDQSSAVTGGSTLGGGGGGASFVASTLSSMTNTITTLRRIRNLPIPPTAVSNTNSNSSTIKPVKKFKLTHKQELELNAAMVMASKSITELVRIEEEELEEYLNLIRTNQINSVPFLLASNIIHAKKISSTMSTAAAGTMSPAPTIKRRGGSASAVVSVDRRTGTGRSGYSVTADSDDNYDGSSDNNEDESFAILNLSSNANAKRLTNLVNLVTGQKQQSANGNGNGSTSAALKMNNNKTDALILKNSSVAVQKAIKALKKGNSSWKNNKTDDDSNLRTTSRGSYKSNSRSHISASDSYNDNSSIGESHLSHLSSKMSRTKSKSKLIESNSQLNLEKLDKLKAFNTTDADLEKCKKYSLSEDFDYSEQQVYR